MQMQRKRWGSDTGQGNKSTRSTQRLVLQREKKERQRLPGQTALLVNNNNRCWWGRGN